MINLAYKLWESCPTGPLATIGCLVIFLSLLESVYMYQDDTWPHFSIRPPIQKLWSKIRALHIWMRHIGFSVEISAATDRNLITQCTALGCCHASCASENSTCITGIRQEINCIRTCWIFQNPFTYGKPSNQPSKMTTAPEHHRNNSFYAWNFASARMESVRLVKIENPKKGFFWSRAS